MELADGQAAQCIGILGGGSAGYLSALYLRKVLPRAEITLIESTRIPVIGVGEATTPLLLDFLHRRLGFPVHEFFKEAKPTIKLGIRFDWGKPGEGYHFNTSFGHASMSDAMTHTGNLNDQSFASLLMEAGKTPFLRVKSNPDEDKQPTVQALSLSRGYAYHVDNQHFLQYLKRKLLESGCHYVDADVTRVECTADKSRIVALHAANQSRYSFDLYLDCSGFRSALLEKTLGVDWVDYSSSLRTSSAVLGTTPAGAAIAPYTTSTTMRHGWLWNTPMPHENHLGYVFSSAHCSDDEALSELRGHCSIVNQERVIRFRPGRHKESWRGNVVAIGNSFAFIEPLQSTGLHMVLRQLRSLAKSLEPRTPKNVSQEKYNSETNKSWDHLRWFVAMHFRFNRRLDTAFWRDCQRDTNLSGLTDYIDHYAKHGPLSPKTGHPLHDTVAIDDIFSVYAHDAILTGCGVNDDYFRTHRHDADPAWPGRFSRQRMLRDQCLPHREALAYLRSTESRFLQEVRTPA